MTVHYYRLTRTTPAGISGYGMAANQGGRWIFAADAFGVLARADLQQVTDAGSWDSLFGGAQGSPWAEKGEEDRFVPSTA